MSKKPSLSKQMLLSKIDYWDKLNAAEKDWLYNFELLERWGIGKLAEEDSVSKANAKNYKYRSDYMNVSEDKVQEHIQKYSKPMKRNKKGNQDVEED